jgi:copper chaperone CopZ
MKESDIQNVTFTVGGNCDMCKERIEKAAMSVVGVKLASWNAETKKIQVQYNRNKINVLAIHKAIAKVGHDTDKVKAPDNVYKALPECCLYRK